MRYRLRDELRVNSNPSSLTNTSSVFINEHIIRLHSRTHHPSSLTNTSSVFTHEHIIRLHSRTHHPSSLTNTSSVFTHEHIIRLHSRTPVKARLAPVFFKAVVEERVIFTWPSIMANFGVKSTGVGSSGFTFGAQPITGTSTQSSGFSFGQPQTSAASPVTKSFFSIPTSTTTPAAGFSFGNFGTTTSTTGIQPATSSSGFGLSTTPALGSSTGFTLGGATLAPATSASTGFSLGGLGSTPSTSGFSLGGAPTVSSSTGFSLGGGLGGVQTSKQTTFGFGNPSGTVSQPTTSLLYSGGGLGGIGIGLGGAQPPSANADANNAGSKTDGKSTKDQQMPQDLFATIALFESRRNAENAASEENIRQTEGPFHKVAKKAEEIQQLLAELASEYLQLHSSALNLKAEVMKEAENVEMARRTKDTPMALQGENKAPEVFFINLVRSFEAEMIYCRTKIEEVSQCMQAASNPCETPEDIAEVLQREHDTLKEVAAKVYAKHSQLVEQSQRLNTKAVPNNEAFFRPQSKEDHKTPASAVVRPVLGGSSSGLQAFQEQQQRAKAVTLGAAPPTMPLAQTTTPPMFGSNSIPSNIFSTGGTSFGTNTFNVGGTTVSSSFGSKPLFGNTSSSAFGNPTTFNTSASGTQQSTMPFSISSPFSSKPFAGDEDADGRRKRRL
ncbi:nucleoporin p58/p45 isoform X3 [Cherax quadricarinatus]|uniref:nucleoporin p58/p45 isoform X3 n=1 Tax=Cherax quadricarinatus TaxID=27406 RepID=UPI00387E286E